LVYAQFALVVLAALVVGAVLLGHTDAALLWIALGALLLAAFLAYYAGRALERSTRELVVTAQAMAAGDLSARSPTHGPGGSDDELGRLGRALDRLGEQLAAQLAQLRGERDRLNAIVEAMAEGVLVLDAQRRVVLANPAVRRILALPGDRPQDAAPGQRGELPDLLDLQRLPALHALAERALHGRRQSEELILQDGRQALVQTAPLEGTGAVLVFHDLTDVRRLETVRRDFVANVSHELRTPLAAIRGYSETLVEGGLEDRARAQEFVAVIHRHAERLARLLDDLLELSRLEAGRRPMAQEALLLSELSERALELVRTKAADRHVELSSAVPANLSLRGDADAVVQVLVNLLDNAVKYTAEGGHVRLRAQHQGDRALRISVEDDGAGIEPQHLDRVFERFYRVDSGRSRDMGGTGLGLAIVKHLVQAMGGAVGVQSVVGRGSTFWFELPAVV
jgi:two-component system phosphate regulon sensor histidine kinase PhoR